MALPRTARTIEVDGRRFRWMTSRASNVLSVPVAIQQAEGRGSRLETVFYVETAWNIGANGEPSLVQKTSVTPKDIREHIQQALRLGWNPGSSGQLRVRCRWGNALAVVPPSDKNRYEPLEPIAAWQGRDALSDLTSCLTEYGSPHPAWLERWGGVNNAWQATCDPGVMMDVLLYANMADELVNILRTFAFREGAVGDLLQRESMGFPAGTGWQRHCDGTNARLGPAEKRLCRLQLMANKLIGFPSLPTMNN